MTIYLDNKSNYFAIFQYMYNNVILHFQERDRILQENKLLRTKIESQNDQISTLKSHIGVIRQHTITFILDQMDTLHMQRDTEV